MSESERRSERAEAPSRGPGRGPAGAAWLPAACLGTVLAAGLLAGMGREPLEQPIAFDHAKHVDEMGLACEDCHRSVLTQARATIPNIEVCGDCHVVALGESAEEERLVAFIEAGEPIPWRQVYWVPDHVYFSHRRHAAIGEIDCERCHGAMAERTTPVTRPAVLHTMDSCITCHEQSGVTNDCIACHR